MPLQSDDTNFLQKLKAEIPAFLYFLTQRELSTTQESRMWFNPRLTHTAALQKIIRSNRNRLEIEMTELLLDIMSNMNVESNLRSVFAFGFHLVGESGAQVFQPFAVFPAVEQNFVQQRISAHTHRRRRNTLLGAEDNAVAE